MQSEKTTLLSWLSAIAIGSLLFTSCGETETKAPPPTFQTPDSILKINTHMIDADGWEFKAQIVKVTGKRIFVTNEEYRRIFDFPLTMLSDSQLLVVTEWQAYKDYYKPDYKVITDYPVNINDTIVPDTGDFEMQVVVIPLKEIELRVEFTYQTKNRELANHMLGLLKRAIPAYEKKSGVPFPGFNPYMVLENLKLKALGLAGPTDAYLCSLDKASEWTLMHEFVHIWNAGGRPSWVTEGLADYIGYQGMIEYGGNFIEGENYNEDMKFWDEFKGTDKDFPLSEKKYGYKYEGTKAMVFWDKVNKEFGDEFTNACFRHNALNRKLTVEDFKELLKAHGEEDPDRITDGWIVTGDYRFE
ncbi:MAG: hypothetical protein HRT71_00100 [Flavobacteriales bacterium]|nr:hypothetical protein [Flavobacteriales bacterium]